MRRKKLKLIAAILYMTVVFSGCWDKVEIDRKAFVSTIGVDAASDIDKEKDLKEMKGDEVFPEEGIKKLKVTYGFPDIKDFSPSKAVIQGDNSFTASTYSMEGAMVKITGMSSREIYLDHTRLLILSRDLLNYKESFKEILDYLERQPKLNRRMYVVMSIGAPDQFIKSKPQMDPHIQTYISGVMENSKHNSTILPVTLNEMFITLSENGNAIVPVIKMNSESKSVELSGTALIKDYKLIGQLSQTQTSNVEILRGKLRSGIKVVYDDGHPLDYEIDGLKRDINMNGDKDNLAINIKIEIEGKLKGAYLDKSVVNTESIGSLEQNLNKSIESECYKVMNVLQGRYNIDPIGIKEHIQKYKPGLWNSIKDDWEDAYKKAKINIIVKTSVRRVGVVD